MVNDMFRNRIDAGKKLMARLKEIDLVGQTKASDMVVLSIPRGGVVIGKEVAGEFGCKHEVVIVKKLGAPWQPELAIGAVAEDGEGLVNQDMVYRLGIENEYLKKEIERVREKIENYKQEFREGRDLNVKEKVIVVVDDGVATGETVRATLKWLKLRFQAPNSKVKVIIALPVCSSRVADEFRDMGCEVVCLEERDDFRAIGQFYEDFTQVDDSEVKRILSSK